MQVLAEQLLCPTGQAWESKREHPQEGGLAEIDEASSWGGWQTKGLASLCQLHVAWCYRGHET